MFIGGVINAASNVVDDLTGQKKPEKIRGTVVLTRRNVLDFNDFNSTARLAQIEEEIIRMNKDKKLKNRVGSVNEPYILLYPSGEVGLFGKGNPNSIST
ncbi:Lipoxygenase [Theobroma cacao]|nr:Lipoxygenase [Theobroma cacao]